jgi:uncharacterized protein YdeI (YjbR/CyaY-like superfamily)
LQEPLKTLPFKSAAAFRKWLERNHASSKGIWLRIFKKDSGVQSITYPEALDQALCHGWIDGQKRGCDALSYLQKFTPRRPKSVWSRLNTNHVERLIKSDQMNAAGHKAVEAAKADGRWQAAYDSPSKAAPPEDFLKALDQDNAAKSFFATLNRTNIYSIVYRLQTAGNPALREKRMNAIVAMLARGETFHPQKSIH